MSTLFSPATIQITKEAGFAFSSAAQTFSCPFFLFPAYFSAISGHISRTYAASRKLFRLMYCSHTRRQRSAARFFRSKSIVYVAFGVFSAATQAPTSPHLDQNNLPTTSFLTKRSFSLT